MEQHDDEAYSFAYSLRYFFAHRLPDPWLPRSNTFPRDADEQRETIRQWGLDLKKRWRAFQTAVTPGFYDEIHSLLDEGIGLCGQSDPSTLESANELRTRILNAASRLDAAIADKAARATKGQSDEAADDPPAAVHSPDFRSVNWFGKQYSFTGNQAAAVKMLWEAWQSGAPDVGGETLLQAADASTQRIDVVFRGNAAWGEMIVPGRSKGSYRLIENTADSPKAEKTSARARK